MNLKFWTKTGVIFAGILGGIYLLFLTLPLLFNFVIDKYTPQIAGEINKATGLSAGIEEIRIVTTPKLTAGIKVKKFELYTPQKEPVIVTDDFQITMSLLPIFAKEIRVDVIKFKNADITLKIDKEGNLDVMKYFPQQEETDTQEDSPQEPFELPFGLKLSNHMPNIHINGYKLNITDGKDDYIVRGGKTDITDFVLNKSIKITGAGNFSLKNREQFKYDIKLFNKIMPDIDLNNLVFSADEEKPKKNQEAVNIIEILRGLYDYNVTADASVDLKTSPENINGSVKLDNVSIINLTPSNAVLNFKGSTIDVNSNIYTAKNEVSNLNGKITTGKKSYLDMNFKSDIELANVLNIVKKVALISLAVLVTFVGEDVSEQLLFFIDAINLYFPGLYARTIVYLISGSISDDSGRDGIHDRLLDGVNEYPIFGYGAGGSSLLLNGELAHGFLFDTWGNFGYICGSIIIGISSYIIINKFVEIQTFN